MTNTCSVPGCEEPPRRQKSIYCNSHYQRWRMTGDVQADVPLRRARIVTPPGFLWCGICKTEKPDEEMSRAEDARNRGRHSGQCKACRRENEKELPESARARYLWSAYKITLEDYDRILASQGGVCMICKKPPGKRNLAVDHDHSCCPGKTTCGKCIRGLLHAPCNGKLDWAIFYSDRISEYITKGPINLDELEDEW